MRNLTLQQLGNLLQINGNYPLTQISGFALDSRQVVPGNVFIATIGEKTDGHLHIEEAKNRGAIGAIVSCHYLAEIENFVLFRTGDPVEALQNLAHKFVEQSGSRVVAITGSVGKTTTKEFTLALLATKYKVAASIGNHNSQLGLPLTLLNHMQGDEDIIILEMGMTEPGHISRLIEIAPPEVAALISTEFVHACYFESIEEIAWAKAEIFSHPFTKKAIASSSIACFEEIKKKISCEMISFSISETQVDYYIDFQPHAVVKDKSNQAVLSLKKFVLPGRHNFHNLLASIAISRHFNVEWELIECALPALQLPKNRLECISKNGITFVNDAYNACEASVKAALDLVPNPAPFRKKIAVLGSMLELGKFSLQAHMNVAKYALGKVDALYCIGKECRPIWQEWMLLNRPVYYFDDLNLLVSQLKKDLVCGDTVLLKGSHGMQVWKIPELI